MRRRATTRKRKPIKIKHPGTLKRVGYDPDYSERVRHAALIRAVKRYGYARTMNKLNAIYVLSKTKDRKHNKIYAKDKQWLMNMRRMGKI